MENYLLGLDNGGTMVKAVIFDGNGKGGGWRGR